MAPKAITIENAFQVHHRDTEKITSPPALSSKLERVPKNYTIVEQCVSITLSTRLWGVG